MCLQLQHRSLHICHRQVHLLTLCPLLSVVLLLCIAVFSYVGGIYFFMRTILNALVKCLYNILYIALHCCWKMVQQHVMKKSLSPETTTVNNGNLAHPSGDAEARPIIVSDPRVSVLGPLPYLKLSKHKD